MKKSVIMGVFTSYGYSYASADDLPIEEVSKKAQRLKPGDQFAIYDNSKMVYVWSKKMADDSVKDEYVNYLIGL